MERKREEDGRQCQEGMRSLNVHRLGSFVVSLGVYNGEVEVKRTKKKKDNCRFKK